MADDTKKTTEEELDQTQDETSGEEEESSMADALGLEDSEESDATTDEPEEDDAVEEESSEEDESEDDDAEDDADVVAAASETSEVSEVSEASEESDVEEESADADDESEEVEAPVPAVITMDDSSADGLAAYFDDPHELLHAAEKARDKGFEIWDAFSPFPIHGIEDAMGIGRSWLPWVTFGAGGTGFLLANALQFGTLTFDWPMIIGGKPHAPWPSFVPIMFELTVLIGGVTSALVMFIASGCFRKPRIIDTEITNDRFVLWIDSKDPQYGQAREFMQTLDPVEIRTVKF